MKLNYRFFDKEDFVGRIITYEYDAPFHKNMDADFKSMYGEDLSFVKELNHADRIIRLHSAYDSGKGTRYVAPKPRKPYRLKLPIVIRNLFLEKPKEGYFVIELENEEEQKIHIILDEARNVMHFYTESSVSKIGAVTGYRVTLNNTEKRLCLYLKEIKFYPQKYTFLKF